MRKYLKTIGKIAFVAGVVTASYFAGFSQNPTFDELPHKAQEAIVETHRDLDSMLTKAVTEYKRGNSQNALEIYREVQEEAESLEKIDPHYEAIERKLFQYGAAIVDTTDIVTKHIDPIYENIVAGTPEKIAEYVTHGGSLSWLDRHLEVIGPKSGAYHRLGSDTKAQAALLNYYVNCSLQWYDAQEKMLATLEGTPVKTTQIEWAIEILQKRMPKIEKDRAWTLQFQRDN